jgi:large subunit ribosomal protein L20
MPRSINNVASRARRKKTLKLAKGYFGRRKNVWTVAKNAVEKGLGYAYRDRRQKKREFRSLWIMRINAACREHGVSYSQFMGKLATSNLDINRKVLADLAMNEPEAFKAVFDTVMNGSNSAEKPAKKAPAKAAPAADIVAEVTADAEEKPEVEAGN